MVRKPLQSETYQLISQTNIGHSSAKRRKWLLTENLGAYKRAVGLFDVKKVIINYYEAFF